MAELVGAAKTQGLAVLIMCGIDVYSLCASYTGG